MTESQQPEPTHHEPIPDDSTNEELTWSPQEPPPSPAEASSPSTPPPPDLSGAPPPTSPYALTPRLEAPAYTTSSGYGSAPPPPASRPLGLGWLWWLAGGCAVLSLCCLCSLMLGLFGLVMGAAPARFSPLPQIPLAPPTPPPPGGSAPQDAPAVEATPAPQSSGPIGQAATDFTVTTLDGQTMRLSDFRGRPVVLNFWASWCGPCREEMPLLSKTYQELKDSGLVMLAVNMQESEATARRYAEQNKLPFAVALDERGEVSGQYRVRSLPTTYFIDSEGVIRSWQVGTLSKMLLDRHLDRIR